MRLPNSCLGMAGLLVICTSISCGKPNAPAVGEKANVVPQPEGQELAAQEPKKDAQPVAKQPIVVEGPAFRFPEDAGGKLLEKTLPPRSPWKLSGPAATGALPRSVPVYIDDPRVPFASQPFTTPLLKVNSGTGPRPITLSERVPQDLAHAFPEVPTKLVMPEGGLTKVPTPDVRRPAELPILARQTPDRAPLTDPTTEFTNRSVIAETLPLRTTEAPFVKVNIPDPFENAETVRPRVPTPEDPAQSLGTPPTPRPVLKDPNEPKKVEKK